MALEDKYLENLFAKNRTWSAEHKKRDPRYFEEMATSQSPAYLWIGCSDSRVPANEIVGLPPGELFVHRNIANVVVHTDFNSLSVIQFAVDVLGIGHIIVCGHHGCGGVHAALFGERHGLVDNWLHHIHDVRDLYEPQLAAIADPVARLDRLCELNVIEQVRNVAESTVVGDAWARGQALAVHGWIYGLTDGLLRDLGVTSTSVEEARRNRRVALDALAP